MTLTLGIDIGATSIKGAAVTESGEVVGRDVQPTPSAGSSADIEDAIVACIAALRSSLPDVSSVGLAAAGWIGPDRRSVVFSANFPSWRQEPLLDRLEQRTGLAMVLENDANAAAWGEYRFGAGAAATSMAAITLGSGVGGALIVNGELVRGHQGAAGEIGHSVMITDGYPCACGRHGCMENYVSGRSINRRAAAILPGADVYELARAGDERALGCYLELGDYLGRGLANVAMLVNPQLVVISGGVSDAYDLFAEQAQRSMRSELGAYWAGLTPEFAAGTLAADAGPLGAADLARHQA
ncbi:ROK family glucokinase [Microlunatus panaciterrae]|uniref:Glucokinase n=1 Tax=Microlunatus panaciterrae TaxID=400768 RepID=A0ABS2RM21_9ACTN|nr:ROK family protein [Microlunatus panaciterrae]MBM7800054.1 glucokinase [Microlunatus panaciterrae]